VRRAAPLGAGAKSLDRGSTFQAERRLLERRKPLAAASPRRAADPPKPMRHRPRRRPATEQEIARDWHELVCRSRRCVKCGGQAGPYGHHAIRKEWMRRMVVLARHMWDLDLGVPVCAPCHDRHETKVDPITRAELAAAGIWQRLVQWARLLDERYFPGHAPVLTRLERDYPMEAA